MDSLIRTVLDRVLTEDPGGIIGVHLSGSSTTTGLGPESDVDLLLVTRKSLMVEERRSLVALLLGSSGWKGHAEDFPDVADRRPLEVTSLVADDLDPLVAAPWRDFQFGEWLRSDFARGYVPEPERDPDVVILLATALASHRVLHGPSLDSLVAARSSRRITRQAWRRSVSTPMARNCFALLRGSTGARSRSPGIANRSA